MQISFYKGENGDWWDQLICRWTNGPYSHVELVFSNGFCCSSSSRDGGSRLKRIPLTSKWIGFDIGHEDKESQVFEWCKQQAGKPYDWLGAVGCGLKWPDLKVRNMWYCSEIVSQACSRFDIIPFPPHLSPNEMYDYLAGANYPMNNYVST